MGFRFFVWVIAGAALLGITSCEPSNAKKASAKPPRQATAPTLTTTLPPETVAKAETQPLPTTDPVQALINRVEADFQTGKTQYKAGRLEQAKASFDKAFDTLLSYPAGVHSDDRLQDEFDKIVEAVNNIEMAALEQGDGFTQQPTQPAPIDEASETTFPVDPNIKAKAELELRGTKSDLPLVMNDYVASYINFYSTKGHGYMERALTRAGRYEPMIRRIFAKEGVPQDLIYLAEAESGFYPTAISRAGARGMWQFMASRAAGYGLERNWWVDERQDPEKATMAAARHLKDLYNQFGDWYLAMAAYNSGPGNVQQAVQRTGYADFWELYKRNVLPQETKNYVPIILAFTIMAKNPAQYGLDHLTPDPPLVYDTVKVDYAADLRLIADCAGTTVAKLQELNPALLRMTTPKEGSYDLHLPSGTAEQFEQTIAEIPRDKRLWWRFHTVTAGESLSEIAHEFKTTPSAIAKENRLREDEHLRVGARLVIPISPSRVSERMAFSKRPTYYKVRRGDTVLTVADDFSVPVERLRRWNHLRGNQLRVGHVLRIYRPVAVSEGRPTETVSRSKLSTKSHGKSDLRTSKRTIHHRVKQGETLYSIAQDYKTTVAELRRDNGKTASHLQAGAILVIRPGQ